MKAWLLAQAARGLRSPLGRRLLRDDRVMKTVIGLVAAGERIRRVSDAGLAWIARRLRLATREDVRELRRTLERLEAALERVETTHGRAASGDAERARAE